MARGYVAVVMMALLIVGCARVFAWHRREAARHGVTLRAADVFTRFPSPPATEQEGAARRDTARSLFKWVAVWLALNFLLGILVSPYMKNARFTGGAREHAEATGTFIGTPQCRMQI